MRIGAIAKDVLSLALADIISIIRDTYQDASNRSSQAVWSEPESIHRSDSRENFVRHHISVCTQ